ncbi:MAG TPA: ribosome small subunit-dependent GTPase A [Bacilli bacterium]
MPNGLIMKALSGYYYVRPDDASGNELVQCRARGVFKIKGVTPLVGDRVVYTVTENGEGTVAEIFPRRSELIRPPIANPDFALLVFSTREPDLNLTLLDKFLVHVEKAGLEAAICFTKLDLAIKSEDFRTTAGMTVREARECYERIGYDTFLVCARDGTGIPDLYAKLQNRMTVVAGQSGVGKSSLLNALITDLRLETAPISMKLGRGKHTTRHVELIGLPHGGMIADTPGFSQLDFADIAPDELTQYFREFAQYADSCKYRGCLHVSEPGCQVRRAKESGGIAPHRYENYRIFLEELKAKKRRC